MTPPSRDGRESVLAEGPNEHVSVEQAVSRLLPHTDPAAYPPELKHLEEQRLAKRRQTLYEGERDAPLVGVGVSGGGIRSATFALGFFQALAGAGLARGIDYLSTVSGGGYFGAFLGTLFTRGFVTSPYDVEQILAGEKQPQVVRNLRDFGRYLAPNGSGDLLLGGAVLLRNWIVVQLLVLGPLIVAFAALWTLENRVPEVRSLVASAKFLTEGWSPWVSVAIVAVLVLAVPPACAYWLVGKQGLAHPGYGLVVVASAPFVLELGEEDGGTLVGASPLAWCLLIVAALTSGCWGFGKARAGRRKGKEGELLQRNFQSKVLRAGLLTAMMVLAIGLIDTIAGQADRAVDQRGLGSWLLGLGASFSLAAGSARRVAVALAGSALTTARPKALARLGAATVAIALSLVVLVAADVVGRRGAQRLQELNRTQEILAAALLLALLVVLGHSRKLLNRTSHQALYSARLSRAYLGASNSERKSGSDLSSVVTEDDPGVDTYFSEQHSQEKGAPLHLINITVNETVNGETKIQQQDRKGVGLAVGPAGMSLGVRHHLCGDWWNQEVTPKATSSPEWRVFREGIENMETGLSVAEWVSISGAAFSTGLGYRTNLGLAFLAGMTNVRLGYWWNSGVRASAATTRTERALFALAPVHAHLLSEFFARFPGTSRPLWYLSDGGHFENLGGYELIRRRLPRIILLDAECDPDYRFEGLSNLIRKARLDFGTEIRFLDRQEAARAIAGAYPNATLPVGLGSLEEMRRESREAPSKSAYAALAEVRFPDLEEPGRLLYVKPAILEGMPIEFQNYHADNVDYPHQSTSDQFFDESQWENYRRLGELMGSSLLSFEPAAEEPRCSSSALRKWCFCAGSFVETER